MKKCILTSLLLFLFHGVFTQDKKFVDYSYSFATPHRLTVCMPNSSDKTLLDVDKENIKMSWTTDDLRNKPLATFVPPATQWKTIVNPKLDGNNFKNPVWKRSQNWMPILNCNYNQNNVNLTIEAAGGNTAAILKIDIANNDSIRHEVTIICEAPSGYNPAWVQNDWDNNVLLAGWKDIADRILVFTVNSDSVSVPKGTAFSPVWTLKPGEKRSGWIIRPYKAFHSELKTLEKTDWNIEFELCINTWKNLINKSAKIFIPDIMVKDAYYACLSDCFVMRETVADGSVVAVPGTEIYRAASPFEPLIVSILFDQIGFNEDFFTNTNMFLEQQGDDGNWADPKGWAHLMWGASGIKSWAIMEHFLITGDTAFLKTNYPRMLASSKWQESQREKTRKYVNGEKSLTYGLMPRGMGDGGLRGKDGDIYDIFIPHNILAVYADKMTLEAAKILEKERDIILLKDIYDKGYNALLETMNKGAISENGYKWIPGVAGYTSGSRWAGLYAAFPCRLIDPYHELITGTIKKWESNVSKGGIPVNTGWMKDGMWVGITLDNLAEVLLLRGEGEKATNYLYAVLNHGTPLNTWCEERAQEPGTDKTSGDRQHLWTSVAVGRYLRDALVLEDKDTLKLGAGIARWWLEQGMQTGIEKAKTHFGELSYKINSDVARNKISVNIDIPDPNNLSKISLHIPHPSKKMIKSVSINGKTWTDYNRKKEDIYFYGYRGKCDLLIKYY